MQQAEVEKGERDENARGHSNRGITVVESRDFCNVGVL